MMCLRRQMHHSLPSRFVPVIGWCWNFSDVIYLHRNWDKDQKAIGDGIQQLQEYPSAMALLIYAEGTRYTEEKYKASLEFAKNKGLPLFKHHLVPRVKGFAETLRQLDPTKIKYIYDLTLVVNEKEGAQATLADVLRNRGMVGEVYIRKIPISEVGLFVKTLLTMFQIYLRLTFRCPEKMKKISRTF